MPWDVILHLCIWRSNVNLYRRAKAHVLNRSNGFTTSWFSFSTPPVRGPRRLCFVRVRFPWRLDCCQQVANKHVPLLNAYGRCTYALPPSAACALWVRSTRLLPEMSNRADHQHWVWTPNVRSRFSSDSHTVNTTLTTPKSMCGIVSLRSYGASKW